jgi:hypothetical protein
MPAIAQAGSDEYCQPVVYASNNLFPIQRSNNGGVGYSSSEEMSADLLHLTGLPISIFIHIREQRKGARSFKHMMQD